MSEFLIACTVNGFAGAPLWLAVLLAGLIGSLSHCSVMCSPMVAAQILQGERTRISMISYHAGRAVTYMLLGLCSYFASQFLFSSAANVSHGVLLIFAGAAFIISAILPTKTHSNCQKPPQKIVHAINRIASPLAQRFVRGMLMGLMPCGMLLSVLLLVATVSSPGIAASMMLLFALATTPVLQLAGFVLSKTCGHNPVRRKQLGRTAMGVNGMYICYLGLSAAAS